MKFIVECAGPDGLVLIDKSYLGELDSEVLYSMEILLDYEGKSELIQCVLYPSLVMEKAFELKVNPGWYAVSINSAREILCCRKTPPMPPFENVRRLY